MATVNELGGVKAPGLLVKSDDWNQIVAEIVRLGTDKANKSELETLRQTILNDLTPALTALQSAVSSLSTTVAALGTRVSSLEAIRDQYYRVALSSSRNTYLVGHSVELVVRLANLDGTPRTFPNALTRPFIDFVTTWGILGPASGSTGTVDAEGRSISVRVDQDGVARARLRAEWAYRVDSAQEAAMLTVLRRNTTSGRTVEEALLGANTAAEARDHGAFAALDTEYHGPNRAFRGYVDKLFIPHLVGELVVEGDFLDTRATVLAFAKANDDPTSPDPASGVASMQVIFRDWIGPLVDPPVLVLPEELPPYWEEILPILEEVDEINLVRENIPERLLRFVQGTTEADGLFGRYQQGYAAMQYLDLVGTPTETGRQLVGQARSLLGLAMATGASNVKAGAGVEGLLELAGQAEQRSKELANDVSGTNQTMRQFETRVSEVQRQVSTLNGQFQATVAEGGAITNAIEQVAELRVRVDGFDGDRIKPTEVRVLDINSNIFQLAERIRMLERNT